MDKAEEYLSKVMELLKKAGIGQKEAIERAAAVSADCIAAGGILHFFGAGHSHMLAEEVFWRAGGLACTNPLLDPAVMLEGGAVKSSMMERLEGLGKIIIDNYDLRAGEVMFVFSTSGRNAVPVDIAIEAKKKGLTVIAITSLPYSGQSTPRNRHGKRLFEVADIVIDTGVDFGDALIDFGAFKAAPGSTVISAALLNAVIARTVELLQAKGEEPPVFVSGNIDGADEKNARTLAKYKNRVRHL